MLTSTMADGAFPPQVRATTAGPIDAPRDPCPDTHLIICQDPEVWVPATVPLYVPPIQVPLEL